MATSIPKFQLRIHHTTKDLPPVLKLLEPASEENSLQLGGSGLRNHALDLGVGQTDHGYRRKYVVEVTDNVALYDLGHDIGDERFLLDLVLEEMVVS